MTQTAHAMQTPITKRYAHSFVMTIALGLIACAPDPKDQIAQRLEQEMKQAGRGASDAERREVAEALASDVVSIGEDAAAIEAAQAATPDRDIAATHATVEDIKAEECANLRLAEGKLVQMQSNPPVGEALTAGELAALPAELEHLRSKQRELCSP
jgi:hypothetical protein